MTDDFECGVCGETIETQAQAFGHGKITDHYEHPSVEVLVSLPEAKGDQT